MPGINGHKSPDIIVAEVVMSRAGVRGAVLLVEGELDHRFFLRWVAKDQCQIIEAEGKPHLLAAMEILMQRSITGVLGVVDDDADSLLGHPEITDVVRSDARDLEGMLVRSDAFDLLLAGWGSISSVTSLRESGRDPRALVVEACLLHGRLRILARHLDLSVNFKKLRIGGYLNERLVTNVVKLRADAAGLFQLGVVELDRELEQCPGDSDLWRIVQGHDLVEAISHGFRWGPFASANLKGQSIARALVVAFPAEQWRNSHLYRAITAWECRTGATVLSSSCGEVG